MTIEKLRSMEPLFDSWYVGSKLAEGKNSKVYKVFRSVDSREEQMCVKTVRFPSSEEELSRIIDSGKYKNVDEYLQILENVIRLNMDKMISLKNHPNIVSIEDYQIIRENSCFYIVMLMEILTPLSHYLKVEAIQARQVINIGTDMCKALAGFRERGIIHHNIRPENIYVDATGNHKLGDFGIYEINKDSSLQINSYTAPETYHRSAEEDLNSDVYSLGILLYKLLNNNRAPFLPDYPAPISLNDRDNAFAKLMRGETLTSPANADYALSKIIFRACAFNPSERYAHPVDLKNEFEYYLHVLSNDPIVSATEQRRNTQQAKAYRIENDNDYYFPTNNVKMAGTVRDGASDSARADYRKVFDDEDEILQDKQRNKSRYIVLGLILIIALIAAIVVSSGKKDKEQETTQETTTSAVISTTSAPVTTATTTAEETTTEETTTEETTTEETTTEQTTTEETTTEVTTTEETTTEETTTEESTAEDTTTEETTTKPTTTKPQPTTEPILVFAQNEAGEKNEDGLTYVDIINYSVKSSGQKGIFTIKVKDDLGTAPVVSGDAFVHIMSGDISITPCLSELTCKNNDDGTYTLTVRVADTTYFYEPDIYQYYVCLEQGSLRSDSKISLPLQVRVG